MRLALSSILGARLFRERWKLYLIMWSAKTHRTWVLIRTIKIETIYKEIAPFLAFESTASITSIQAPLMCVFNHLFKKSRHAVMSGSTKISISAFTFWLQLTCRTCHFRFHWKGESQITVFWSLEKCTFEMCKIFGWNAFLKLHTHVNYWWIDYDISFSMTSIEMWFATSRSSALCHNINELIKYAFKAI